MNKNLTVLVGLSGGVDSSVAALLLKEQGYNVIGATMSIWGVRKHKTEPHLHARKNACFGPDEKNDIESARKIAKQLDIPYYVLDCSKDYTEIVLNRFKSEYLKGSTPNPCVWCNALIKFGALPHAAKHNGIKFDKFATGHYVQVENRDGKYYLKRGINPKKDQSYFLYKLKQDQLKDVIFPLGMSTKEEIREIARKYELIVADKPDSQDFYDGDYNELLGVEDKIGNIVDINGKILGQHKGIWNYTIGQRKGLGVSSTEPLYVIKLDKDKNEVVVGNIDATFKKILYAQELNLVTIDKLPDKFKCQVKYRSTQQPVDVEVEVIEDDKIKVTFEEYQKSIAKGQSVVLYDNDVVIGGGTIKEVE